MKQQIEYRPLGDLIPYARNARTHSPEQIEQIVASIQEFGWTNPVLVDGDNGIIAGHGRVMAAQLMGIAEVPCVELSHLTDTQKRAYIIADNKLALNAGWDEVLLNLELQDLSNDGFDIELTGFSEEEISLLVNSQPEPEFLTDPDQVPDVPEIPVSRPGDIWLLGRHRIICGSSTDADVVSRLLAGVKPHLMVTDPPYGVEYDAAWRDGLKGASGGAAKGKVLNDDRADWREAWALFPGDVAYIWHASTYTNVVSESLISCGFDLRSHIVWAKSQLVLSRGHYHHQHEPCWYAVRKGKTAHWQKSRKQSTLWRYIDDVVREGEGIFIRREDINILHAISGDESTVWDIPNPLKSETGHSTQKPVECMRRPIQNNSQAGDSLYEPFSGSGTTIIAAEQTGRTCYAVELSERYVDVAVNRWQDFTGRKAILEGDGRTFEAISAGR